jgi:hypothetical protein
VPERQELDAMLDMLTLLERGLSSTDRETLIRWVRSAELAFELAPSWSGLVIAELRHRYPELSWEDLHTQTGVSIGTLRRRERTQRRRGTKRQP